MCPKVRVMVKVMVMMAMLMMMVMVTMLPPQPQLGTAPAPLTQCPPSYSTVRCSRFMMMMITMMTLAIMMAMVMMTPQQSPFNLISTFPRAQCSKYPPVPPCATSDHCNWYDEPLLFSPLMHKKCFAMMTILTFEYLMMVQSCLCCISLIFCPVCFW